MVQSGTEEKLEKLKKKINHGFNRKRVARRTIDKTRPTIMGFRSDVVIALNEDAYLKHGLLADKLPAILKDEAERHDLELAGKKVWYFRMDSVKWYPSYDAVKQTHEFLDSLPEGSWGMMIANEDATHEEFGDPYEFDIYVVTEVRTP